VRLSLELSAAGKNTYDCGSCDERTRQNRNCANRNGLLPDLAHGKDEWLQIPADLKHSVKFGDLKFYACPLLLITPETWSLLEMVNDCISAEHGDIINLPYPGTLTEQPAYFREAVRIVRAERAAWRNEQMEARKHG
jgi:hypothetical protein